jgi:selenocysteine lyase/cysteine desulfurase
VKWWIPKDRQNPKLHPEDLKDLLSDRTRLVTCTHASNILGTIHDIKGIAKMVHSIPGAQLCVDAVAYAPHRPIDVRELDVDFYAFSWYKASLHCADHMKPTSSHSIPSLPTPLFSNHPNNPNPQVYGPHISLLYAHPRALSTLSSLGHYFNPHSTLENKLGLAASNYELTSALPVVASYFGSSPSSISAAWASIRAHEAVLQDILLAYLRGRKDVTIFGEPSSDPGLRVPTISFVIDGYGSRSVVERVEKESRFGFRWGAFYSNRLVEEVLGLGKEGVVRVSMVHYNTGMFIEKPSCDDGVVFEMTLLTCGSG